MNKLRIWINSFIRSFFYHLVFWYLAFLFFVFLTGHEEVFCDYFKLLEIDSVFLNTFYLAIFLSFLFTFLDGFFSDRFLRHSPVRFLALLRSFFYFVIVLAIFFFAANSFDEFKVLIKQPQPDAFMPEMNPAFFRFLVYFYVACFLNNIFRDMQRRIGRANYSKWLWGMLRKPREEELIFMFIDMTSSTTIAEKLGHRKFSYLVQDVFADLSVIYNYGGHIYNYVGDGAIISWSVKRGTRNNDCLNAFFAFQRVINKRRKAYNRKYGLVPAFKAGMHAGKIMVLQVGTIRRDISYNGDTLNTTARIEAKCGELKRNFLISGDLYQLLEKKQKYSFKKMDSAKLKGKKKNVDIYDVSRKESKNGLFNFIR